MWNKLDPGLASKVARFQQGGEEAETPIVNAVVQFRGDIDELRALGFIHLVATERTRAFGTFHLRDLERITAHPGILKLSIGRQPKPALDKSIPDVRASEVWHQVGLGFTAPSGAGVVVAVIDTGIDFQHPFFRKSQPPQHATRILRIWDMGLTPRTGESSPPVSRLHNASHTYGVEYTEQQINDALGGSGTVRTRDCAGHGTHVASIAAGNGGSDFKYVGVAPTADIIAVKLLLLEETPMFGGAEIQPITLFQDAVTYVLKTVHDEFGDRPVVINCSFGTDTGPHDGFTDEEDWLTETFGSAPGKVVVFSAGNSGGAFEYKVAENQTIAGVQHIELHFTEAATAIVPIHLYDVRTKTVDQDLCRTLDRTDSVELNLFYPQTSTIVTCSIDCPDDTTGFIAGPPLSTADPPPPAVPITFRGWMHAMTHHSDDQNLRSGATVQRSLFKVEFGINGLKKHRTGLYRLRVATNGPVRAHLYVGQADRYGLAIDVNALPAQAVDGSWDHNTIEADAGSKGVIAVAAYDAEGGAHELAAFSSRGQLPIYDIASPTQPPKPDIAAPGLAIDAAQSRDIEGAKKKYKRAEKMQGTSMAAPHVAGAAALILEKKPTLTGNEVKAILRGNVHAGRPVDPDTTGAGHLDVKNAIENTPA